MGFEIQLLPHNLVFMGGGSIGEGQTERKREGVREVEKDRQREI